MSTRSYICKELPNGKYKTIYCHFDGYLEHNGLILNDVYNTEEKVDQLLELGNLSSLHPLMNPDPSKEHHSPFFQENVCIAYGRDCNEEKQEAREMTLKEMFHDTWIEYFYIFTKDKKWIFSNEFVSDKKLNFETEESLKETFKDLAPEIDNLCIDKQRKEVQKWSME